MDDDSIYQGTLERVQTYYDQSPQTEWERLERHKMEYAVTYRTLQEYLPPAPATILDIGGGPGRYALALAQAGHQVTLLDLSSANLALARERAQAQNATFVDYIHGNALDLAALLDSSYDAVLLLGPLYHLFTLEERQRAITEAYRVLKTDGVLFGAFITRYSALLEFAHRRPQLLLPEKAAWEELLRTGIHRQQAGWGFTDAYFAYPDEIKPLMETAGFTSLDLIGCEGISCGNEELVNALTGEDWKEWVELNYRLGKDPSIHGAVYHLLYVGKK